MARVVFPCCAALSGQNPATSAVADGRSGKVIGLLLVTPCVDGVVVWEWLWGGGRLRAIVALGLPFGLVLGGWMWAALGSAAQAVGTGLVSGVLYGSFMAVYRWHVWPRGGQLSSSDRVAVMRAVQRGERVLDPRLAPEVLGYAKVIDHAAERSQRQRWALWVGAALPLAFAAGETVTGSAARSAYFWAFTAIFLGVLWRAPRILARRRGKAAEAARLAADQINGFLPE